MQGRAVNAGLQGGRIAVVVAWSEALAPCARFVIEVPIKRLGELQALRDFQAQRMNVAEVEHHRAHALTTGAYSELDRLLDRVDGVAASVDQCHDLRFRGLRLQQKRREVLAVDRRTQAADTPPAPLFTPRP